MKLAKKCALSAFALCAAIAPVSGFAAGAFSNLFSFGDSLSDAGNVFLATSGAQPAPPYSNGQFSNGPTWVQGLSTGLGLGFQAPSLAGGNDYAFGGATTSNQATTSTNVPNLTQQISAFGASLGSSPAPSTALYTVWIGSNDIFNILGAGAASPCATNPTGCVLGAAQAEARDIHALTSLGARSLLVPFVSDLGGTPLLRAAGPAAQAAATALSAFYNTTLQASLSDLSATATGVDLRYLDVFSILDAAIADPSAFGLLNVTDPCYIGPETGGGTVCANPDGYLFWDQVHPTATGHSFVARAALAEIPEPGMPLVMAIGLLALWAVRRQRSRSGT